MLSHFLHEWTDIKFYLIGILGLFIQSLMMFTDTFKGIPHDSIINSFLIRMFIFLKGSDMKKLSRAQMSVWCV